MKMTIEIDCTPDEARQFCGLPDVKPMQTAVMAQVENGVLDGMKAMTPEALLKSWMPFAQPGTLGETLTNIVKPFLQAIENKPKP